MKSLFNARSLLNLSFKIILHLRGFKRAVQSATLISYSLKLKHHYDYSTSWVDLMGDPEDRRQKSLRSSLFGV